MSQKVEGKVIEQNSITSKPSKHSQSFSQKYQEKQLKLQNINNTPILEKRTAKKRHKKHYQRACELPIEINLLLSQLKESRQQEYSMPNSRTSSARRSYYRRQHKRINRLFLKLQLINPSLPEIPLIRAAITKSKRQPKHIINPELQKEHYHPQRHNKIHRSSKPITSTPISSQLTTPISTTSNKPLLTVPTVETSKSLQSNFRRPSQSHRTKCQIARYVIREFVQCGLNETSWGCPGPPCKCREDVQRMQQILSQEESQEYSTTPTERSLSRCTSYKVVPLQQALPFPSNGILPSSLQREHLDRILNNAVDCLPLDTQDEHILTTVDPNWAEKQLMDDRDIEKENSLGCWFNNRVPSTRGYASIFLGSALGTVPSHHLAIAASGRGKHLNLIKYRHLQKSDTLYDVSCTAPFITTLYG